MTTWREDPYDIDKAIRLIGPDNGFGYPLGIEVDYDDVNHYVIDQYMPIILHALEAIPKEVWEHAQAVGQRLYDEQMEAEINGDFED